jgi:hypothetical protein
MAGDPRMRAFVAAFDLTTEATYRETLRDALEYTGAI